MAHRPLPSLLCAALLGLGGGAACGGGQPSATPPPAAAAAPGRPDRRAPPAPSRPAPPRMSVAAETGGLSQGGVQAAFAAAMPEVERCLRAGRARLPYLGGDIEALVEIDEQGRATGAYLGRSTLGDEQVEECILEAYRSRPWPRPVGGKTGQARQGYSFGAAPDQPAPLDWKPDALAAAMEEEARRERAEAGHDGGPDAATAAPSSPFAELVAKLGRCRTEPGAGRIEITMYLDEDGMVQSVGLATSDARSRAALGCIAMVVKTTSFPSPGNQIAKVTMGIE